MSKRVTTLLLACATSAAGCLSPDDVVDGVATDDLATDQVALRGQPVPWHQTARTPYLGLPRVTEAQAQYRATTAAELFEYVENLSGNRIIWIPFDADIVLYRTLVVPAGVTIAGERGMLGTLSRPGPRLRTPWALKPMIKVPVGSDNVRITGLRLEGPSASTDEDAPDAIAIRVESARNVRIDYNEISKWPIAGVDLVDHGGLIDWDTKAHVTDNFLHHNQKHGLGYGVVVSHGAYARIDRNTFNHHRHGITSGGQPGSAYFAYYNMFLSETHGYHGGFYYGQHLDVHGTGGDDHHGGGAGERFDIGHNTIAGDQSAHRSDIGTRPAFRLRGTPSMYAVFHNNAVDHDNREEAVSVDCGGCSPNLNVHSNQYETTSYFDLSTGDFDGDGRTDVFRATGAGWWYSSGGRTEWRLLNVSKLRQSALRFADFDSDGETDVLTRTADGQMLWSRSGREVLMPMQAVASNDFANLRFADFTGDFKTDILRTTGTHWYLWDGATRSESLIGPSRTPASDLMIGDFDQTLGKDVLTVGSDDWKIHSGARGAPVRFRSKIADSFEGLRVADVNHDGWSDIVRQPWAKPPGPLAPWQYLAAGQGSWQFLRDGGARDVPMLRYLFGDFDGALGDEALYFAPGFSRTGWIPSPYFWLWSRGDDMIAWSQQGMI